MEIITLISSIIMAIATGALAIFTWRYVKFTGKLAQETKELATETKRMVDQMNMSDVAVFFKNERPKSNINIYFQVHFCVKNVGMQTVRKVRFEGDLCFYPNDKDKNPYNKPIGDIIWVKSGIEVLLPQEVFSDVIYTANYAVEEQTFKEISPSKANIKLIYEDIFKREHSVAFSLDLHEIDVYKEG